MNQVEWKYSEKYPGKYIYYNKTRKLQKLLVYNEDKNATVIHHLRDTEEQRNYNDIHYELWGFEIDENGEEHFEYGKYVIFVTKEEHTKIHSTSEETRKKRSDKNSGILNGMYGKHHTDETKKKMSNNHYNCAGENNPMYGKQHSEDSRKKMSLHRTGENNPFYGKHHSNKHIQKLKEINTGKKVSDETKHKLSESIKAAYKLKIEAYNKYLEDGGTMSKKEFFSVYKLHK